MRKVFLDDLPRWKSGRCIGMINWKETKGCNVNFEYDGLVGMLKIIDFNVNNRKLAISYNNIISHINIQPFVRGDIRSVLNIPNENSKYKYKLNTIIKCNYSNIKIIDKIRIPNGKSTRKGYEYICLDCGYKSHITESNLLKGHGCSVCRPYSNVVKRSVNDIATTNPELMKYFVNIEDAFTYSNGTARKFKFKCPDCGNIEMYNVSKVISRGFSCKFCSDGISYPNKFMINLLYQLKLNCEISSFEKEKKFNWCTFPSFKDKNKLTYGIYDFVINEKNIIIEMDGGLGHGNCVFSKAQTSIEETIYNDKMKDILANKHGYKVIRVDCNYNDNKFNYIYKNILSCFNDIFNLDNIDWDYIKEKSNKNKVKEACDMWNSGLKIISISNALGIKRGTISKYLKLGNELKWCNYNASDEFKKCIERKNKQIVCLENNKIYKSAIECERISEKEFGIKLLSNSIYKSCNKKVAYKGYHFLKFEDYNSLSKEDIIYIKSRPENRSARKVINITTGCIYNSSSEVSRVFGSIFKPYKTQDIIKVFKGYRWMYYDEYLEQQQNNKVV